MVVIAIGIKVLYKVLQIKVLPFHLKNKGFLIYNASLPLDFFRFRKTSQICKVNA